MIIMLLNVQHLTYLLTEAEMGKLPHLHPLGKAGNKKLSPHVKFILENVSGSLQAGLYLVVLQYAHSFRHVYLL